MNTILLFFVLPLSTIILSIVLQKILKCPILVAGTFFAIFLIVTYVVDSNLLIFAIAYTIISYITATLSRMICNLIEKIGRCCNNEREGEIRTGCLKNNNCICNNDNSCSNNNSSTNANSNQARFTLTTNQANPVLFLTNQNSNQCKRNNCCFNRR